MSCVSRPTWYTKRVTFCFTVFARSGSTSQFPAGSRFPSAEEPIAPAKFVSTRWTISVSLSRTMLFLIVPWISASRAVAPRRTSAFPPLQPP